VEAEAEAAWTLGRERASETVDCGWVWGEVGGPDVDGFGWLGVVPIELSSFQYIYYFYIST
jgi:hypothetical protein